MRDERAQPPLDAHAPGPVAQARAHLEPRAGLGVSAVVAKPDLGGGPEQVSRLGRERALALENEPQAGRARFRGEQLGGALAPRADPHRLGSEVETESAPRARREHLSLHPTAPMRIEKSAGIARPSLHSSVSSPARAPASAQADTRALRSSRA